MDVKITRVICPKCNEGGFRLIDGKEVCTICGAPLTDETIEAELDNAWANHKMLEGGKFDKFTVIKNEDVQKYIADQDKGALIEIQSNIEDGRLNEGRNIGNTYLVINTDEPYASEVIEILKRNGHWG
jgi:uncharacterized Zn finger protein (UPF0148 family)